MISASKLALGAWLATAIVGIEAQQDPLATVAERMKLRASVNHAGGSIAKPKDVLYSNEDGEKGKAETFQEQLDVAIRAFSKEEDADYGSSVGNCVVPSKCIDFYGNTKPILDKLEAELKTLRDTAVNYNTNEPCKRNRLAANAAETNYNEFQNQVEYSTQFDELMTALEKLSNTTTSSAAFYESKLTDDDQFDYAYVAYVQTNSAENFQDAITTLIETETVVFQRVYASLIVTIPAGSGEYTQSYTITTGYQSKISFGADLNAKVSVETGELEKLAAGTLNVDVAVDFSASFNFDYDTTTTKTITIDVASDTKDTYLYQSQVEAQTNFARKLSFSGGSLITNEPILPIACKTL